MKRLTNFAKYIWNDEQGAEGLEKLLILAAVALPLLGLLIWFRNDIQEWIGGQAQAVRGDGDNFDTNNTGLGG